MKSSQREEGKAFFKTMKSLERFSKDTKRAYKNDGSRKVENSGSRFFLVHGQTCHQPIDLSMTIGAKLRRMPRSRSSIIVQYCGPLSTRTPLGSLHRYSCFLIPEAAIRPSFFIDTGSQYVQRAALTDMLVDGPLFPTRDMQLILRGVSSGDVYGTLRVVPNVDQGTWLHLSTKDYDWPTFDIYGKKWLQNQFSTSFGR